jgi:hypothetical protein
MGSKLNSSQTMAVPGPGVILYLFSHTKTRNMIINLGLKEVEDTHWVKAQEMILTQAKCLALAPMIAVLN